MCLEGIINRMVSKLPGGNYLSGFVSVILLCVAIFLAVRSGNYINLLPACVCPALYILYALTTMTKKKKKGFFSSGE